MKVREVGSEVKGLVGNVTEIRQGGWVWVAPIRRYERHLSAVAMVVGFVVDNFTFGRIDRPRAHIIFAGYLAVAVASILITHALQARADRKATSAAAANSNAAGGDLQSDDPAQSRRRFQLRLWIPAVTQFALGGLWSGFLVFYSRSATLAASWPFVVLLFGFLVGNEVFRRYHARLVFASLLLFFALYSYAIFLVPVFTRTIGLVTFLASGALAIITYFLFLHLLDAFGHARYRQSRLKLIGGAIVITLAINAFYFTGVLPPLPLALSDVGIFHAVRHTGAVYLAQAEDEPLAARLGIVRPVIHVAPGEKLELYSAVFAPIRMTTRITHRWQWWDAKAKLWRTQSVVSFAISGGRERGYRGYSVKSNVKQGDWRVDIDSEDGRLIGRLAFTVAAVATPVQTTTRTLQ